MKKQMIAASLAPPAATGLTAANEDAIVPPHVEPSPAARVATLDR